MLALQHARDHREFYGRYADRELVWEVVAADETEDYYEVRLSYRPAGIFRGRPGVEQFTIDKTGPIEFRQIVSPPIEKRRWVLLVSLATVVGLVVAGAVVAAIFAQDGTSPELTEAPARPTPIAPESGTSPEFIGGPARGAWFYPITANTPLRWSPLNGDVTIALDTGSVDRVTT